MSKIGFVYIWYDRKHKRFYVGSHWGNEDDGYVCSSTWMIAAYARRPKDFKRRILTRVNDRKALREEEFRWLSFIKPHELKTRYYNLKTKACETWPEKSRLRVAKLKEETGYAFTPEHREALAAAQLGKVQSDESKAKRSESLRKAHAEGRHTGMRGKKWDDIATPEQRAEKARKISESLTGKPLSDSHKQKIMDSGFGQHWKGKTRSEETKAKMAEARRLYWEKKRQAINTP